MRILNSIRGMVKVNKKKIIDISNDLRDLSKEVLEKSENIFDIERFERISEISKEMKDFDSIDEFINLNNILKQSSNKLTPKLDSRAAIFKNGKILLVQESNMLWTMPGGWIDYNMSLRENIVKESLEEAGVKVEPIKIITVQDRKIHNKPEYIYNIYKIFVLSKYIEGNFIENSETLSSGFFGRDEIPPLSQDRTSISQVDICFEAYSNRDFIVEFD